MYALDASIDGGRIPWHSSDIPLIFDNADTAPAVVNTEYTEKAQKLIVESLGSFLHTGDPNDKDIIGWEPVTADTEHTLIIEEQPRIGVNYDRELMQELTKDEVRLGKGAGFSFATDV